MNKRRLLRLADLLDGHRDNGVRFDLGLWRAENWKEEDGWCGTKACAVGLACVDPKFVNDGLTWGIPGALYKGGPAYKGFSGWSAVQKFFGLKEGQETYLFTEGAYRGATTGDAAARKVAKRIRKTVSDGFPDHVEKQN